MDQDWANRGHRMTNYAAILGAPDPEMEEIENLLRGCGVTVVYATHGGERVRASNAYRADGIAGTVTDSASVLVVECDGPAIAPHLSAGAALADHHRLGDPGYGRPPSEFLAASSLGQVITWLARMDALPAAIFGRVGATGSAARIAATISYHHYVGAWCVVDRHRTACVIPHHLVLTAAADHCLGAAYRGECPGVDPDELMRWRVESRAKFQGVDPGVILGRIEVARRELALAPVIELDAGEPDGCLVEGWCCNCGGSGAWHSSRYWDEGDQMCDRCAKRAPDPSVAARDMRRDTPVPELVEAATRDGISYVSGPLIGPDGRRKFTVSGTQEVVAAFRQRWAPANGLVDIYGDPARGFAGGYEA